MFKIIATFDRIHRNESVAYSVASGLEESWEALDSSSLSSSLDSSSLSSSDSSSSSSSVSSDALLALEDSPSASEDSSLSADLAPAPAVAAAAADLVALGVEPFEDDDEDAPDPKMDLRMRGTAKMRMMMTNKIKAKTPTNTPRTIDATGEVGGDCTILDTGEVAGGSTGPLEFVGGLTGVTGTGAGQAEEFKDNVTLNEVVDDAPAELSTLQPRRVDAEGEGTAEMERAEPNELACINEM